MTLEALKNAVDTDYQGLIGFSDGYDAALKNSNVLSELKERQSDLDQFAENHSLFGNCIFSLGHFCKGKWHLQYFINEVKKCAQHLYESCGETFPRCLYCEIEKKDSCLYKVKFNTDTSHMTKFLKGDLSNANLDYLKHEFGRLSA